MTTENGIIILLSEYKRYFNPITTKNLKCDKRDEWKAEKTTSN
jgi:hypothetical protein